MKVSNILSEKRVITIGADAKISELVSMLSNNNIGAVVVSQNGHDIQGIVSERDVVRRLAKETSLDAVLVSDLMTKDVQVCRKDDTIASVMQAMTKGKFRHCPVIDESGVLISIVSIGDIVKAYINELSDERDALNSYIHQ